MGSYPWGPHGPQSGPNEVTPNPTPAYVPPPEPSGGSWAPPAYNPSASSYGAPAAYSGGAVYGRTFTPRPKSYLLALILSFLFGPLGLFYATKKGALVMLLLLVGVPVGLGVLGTWGGAIQRHPLEILGHDSVMNRFWSVSVFFSMIWSVIRVRGYNKRLKAGG